MTNSGTRISCFNTGTEWTNQVFEPRTKVRRSPNEPRRFERSKPFQPRSSVSRERISRNHEPKTDLRKPLQMLFPKFPSPRGNRSIEPSAREKAEDVVLTPFLVAPQACCTGWLLNRLDADQTTKAVVFPLLGISTAHGSRLSTWNSWDQCTQRRHAIGGTRTRSDYIPCGFREQTVFLRMG
jgi:hypothetical protein